MVMMNDDGGGFYSIDRPFAQEAVFGENMKEVAGGSTATRSNFRTDQGTAANFVGQKALATKDSVNLASSEVTNKSLANLDSAANSKLSGVETSADVTKAIGYGPAEITINYDYEGNEKPGELPVNQLYKLQSAAGAAVTSGVSWTETVVSGTASASISGSGSATLTINSLTTSNATIELKATYGGRTYRFTVRVSKNVEAAPTGGTGSGGSGQAASTTSMTGVGSTSYSEVCRISPTAGSGGTIEIRLPDAILTPNGTENETASNVAFQVQFGVGASPSSWTNVGSVTNSNPDPSYWYDSEMNRYFRMSGSATISVDHTGRTSGQVYTYRLLGRISSGQTRSIGISGTFSGTPT